MLMNKIFWIKALILYTLIFIPTFVQPLGLDYSIFLLGGKNILNGGRPYADFIDIKPQGVYYFFSLVYAILGDNPFLNQLFLACLHIISALLISKILLDKGFSNIESILAPVPMLLIICSFDFNNRMQLENFFIFFAVIIVFLLFSKGTRQSSFSDFFDNWLRWFIIGVVSGFLFFLKYTFGVIILLPILFILYDERNVKEKIKFLLFLAVGFFLVFLILGIPIIFDKEAFEGFLSVQKYLSYYYVVQFQSQESYLTYAIKNFANFWGENFSLLFSLFAFLGLWRVFVGNKILPAPKKLLKFFYWATILIIFSIFVENKFFHYHFTRVLPFISPFVSFGAIEIYKSIKEKPISAQKKAGVVFVFLFFLLSPVPYYANRTLTFFQFFINREAYWTNFERKIPTYHLLQQTQIADFLNPKISESDTFLIISISSPQLYLMLKTNVVPRFPLSCFYLSTFEMPKNWKQMIVKDLEHCKYLIFQNDDKNWIFGHSKTSWEAFIENPNFKKILETRFHQLSQTKNYKIFERRK